MDIINRLMLGIDIFTGLSFAYVIVPLSAVLCRILKGQLRTWALAAVSLFFCFFSQSFSLVFIILLIALDYVAVKIIIQNNNKPRIRKLCMFFAVTKGMAAMCGSLFAAELNNSPAVIGVVVCALSGIEAVLEAYKRECEEVDFAAFMLYCVFFPRLYTGPLCTYKDFASQLKTDGIKKQSIFTGTSVFIKGIFKAAVMGKGLLEIYLSILNIPKEDATVISSWALAVVFALTVYFVLSGLSEIAQGIGKMLGIALPQNFYYPYQSRSISDFFERFNMTITAFLKHRVCGDMLNGSFAKSVFGMLVLCIFSGLFFGISTNIIAWGIYMALFMAMEKYIYKKAVENIPTLIVRFFTACVVILGFAIISAENLTMAAKNIKIMYSFGTIAPYYNNKILYILSSNWLIILLACFFATNIINIVATWLRKSVPKIYAVFDVVLDLAFLFVYTVMSL